MLDIFICYLIILIISYNTNFCKHFYIINNLSIIVIIYMFYERINPYNLKNYKKY